ncbi:MAG: C13 family peptidase [Hyphomicrobiaceae bacterium]
MQAPRLIRYLQSSLWALSAIVAVALTCSDPSSAAPRQRIDAQAIHARQPQLLKETLAKIKPTARDRPQLYFVGVAGFGSQAVFMREVRAVRELFDRRFGTLGRSIALINHASTLHDVPLATVVNLEHVLLHLGQRVMDADRDTLFLFMTSHGEVGEFAIQMPRIALAQLTPAHLKLMLDHSGIRNRVIVISACHSGSFISALADARTLVMTAARADRSSFGCEDQRRWTYFGDAYFNRALREESSFTRAFANAKRTIRLWEGAERLKPSLPQIAGGEGLGPALVAVGHD